MKKTLIIIIKTILIALVIGYMGLLIVEYFRYQNNEPMLIVLKTETKDYDDGHVYVYYGLGYKAIDYERKSIYGKQFGHLFIRIKDKI